MALTGSYQDIDLSPEEIQEIIKKLPTDLSEERKQVVLTAYQLLEKVNYFWGGKSLVLGWDSRWGTPMEVTAAGSSSSGTVRPFGLDCSGFVDWVFYNQSGGAVYHRPWWRGVCPARLLHTHQLEQCQDGRPRLLSWRQSCGDRLRLRQQRKYPHHPLRQQLR